MNVRTSLVNFFKANNLTVSTQGGELHIEAPTQRVAGLITRRGGKVTGEKTGLACERTNAAERLLSFHATINGGKKLKFYRAARRLTAVAL